MATRVGDILRRRAKEGFVGRRDEKVALLGTLLDSGPLVLFVHGIAGIGKSSLLEAFSEEARARGAQVVRMDCRSVEPTECGFLAELGAAIGSYAGRVEQMAERLGHLGQRVVLILDTYEVFRLMDTWLRRVFIPTLPDNVRVVLCGREAPVSAWLTSPEWEGLFRSIPMAGLGRGHKQDFPIETREGGFPITVHEGRKADVPGGAGIVLETESAVFILERRVVSVDEVFERRSL